MPGPFHDFLLLPETGDREQQYLEHCHNPAAVALDDSLVRYMHDSLRWAPSENPSMGGAAGFGLNTLGATALSGNGARQLVRVLNAWRVLFRCGPEILTLTCATADRLHEDAPLYERSEHRRDDVLETLERISALADEAIAPGHWLLHLGL